MDLITLLLILFSTFCHAYWNMVLKRTSGGFTFIWLFTVVTVILYTPIIISISGRVIEMMDLRMATICILSMIFHLLYFIFLDKAYKYGDLSIIYPVARGIAPAITIIIAIVFLNENLTNSQTLSVVMVIIGTLVLSGIHHKPNQKILSSLLYAILCGFMVSIYTIVDKIAVANHNLSPFLIDYVNNVGRVIILLPFVIKNTVQLRHTFEQYWKEAIIIATLSPLSYILILIAMKSAPVSLVSPLRQMSIVLSGILGVRVLCESKEYTKVAGILITFLGVILLSI